METIIKQSADGLILSRDNNFDTNLGKLFINNHEITDIDTFFKVAEENTRLLEQVKKQKEVIDKAIEKIKDYKIYCEKNKGFTEYTDIEIEAIEPVISKLEDILKGVIDE